MTSILERSQGGRRSLASVDVRDADIIADLATHEGREALVAQARELSGGSLDAVIANAGLATESAATVAVNYFGALATLEGLRPLLSGSVAPRAVATASMASLFPVDVELVDACLAHDEPAALHRATELLDSGQGGLIYGSTKRALVRWIRQNAAISEWAGAGIPLNGVAPGVIETAMTAQYTETEEARKAILEMVPMQVVFIDGGSDVVIRGDSTW